MAGVVNASGGAKSGRHPATYGEKVDLFGVGITVTDYDDATDRILEAARARTSYAVSALAVHGLMEAVDDEELRDQVNRIDLVTPDGQPVRWAMNALHHTGLTDRVYGPDLTWLVIEAAAKEGIGIYLFGSTEETCLAFAEEIVRRYPTVIISDIQPDRFRDATEIEDAADTARINKSRAGLVLVGRGCPRQERWVAAHRGRVNAAMLAVGAAFDYGAGTLGSPPPWVQRVGLQWLYRLVQEPSRLWRRYLVTNTKFVVRFGRALAGRLAAS
ncbi:MAG: WecB/TagA/CpsF family glycosyltransferase [Acidimicrobiia bacterium]|nr:WecB/TagA/CpsF family glycosyltransferase [Acidimicrobiia bacterium]